MTSSHASPTASVPSGPTRWANGLCNLLVMFGGLCLLAAALLTGLSIVGGLALTPLPGEIELVEALCGFAVFAFLPYCQLVRGHVGVDLFLTAFGPKVMRWSQLIGDLVIAILFGIVTWRHTIGFMDKLHNGETTPLLLLPIWWGYAVALVLLAANMIICLYALATDIHAIRHGQTLTTAAGAH
jgi:TRAP-type C4-dicarboxylate transport system permease small subunit